MAGVLLIAYHYPPMRASGTARAEGFVRHLPGFGYHPCVLSAGTYGGDGAPDVVRANELVGLYRFLFNRGQRALPPAERSLARTDVRGIGRLAAWCRRYLLIPDGQIGWLPHALAVGIAAIRKRDLRLICSTSPPHSAHLLGLALQTLTGLPWVADFRDTWTYDPLEDALLSVPTRLELERALESAVLYRADRIVAVTGVACADFRSRFPEIAGKIRLIPNGFDAAPAQGVQPSARPDGPLCLVHTGSFSYSHPLRTPAPLFQALNAWQTEVAGLADRLQTVLVGPLSPEEERLAAPLVDRGLVRLTGPLPRAEAIGWQQRADVLLLMDPPRPVRASNVPAKCYEYLRTGRPILALVPDGATRDLIGRLNAGLCAPPDDFTAIRRAICRLVEAGRAGRLSRWCVSPRALRPFHRSVLTGQLARCFDELLKTA